MYKMYCIFSKEALKKMNGVRGKMAAQSGHAFLHSFWDSSERFPEKAQNYRNGEHAFKICLVVDTDKELIALYNEHKQMFGCVVIKDKGFTVFDEPTVTCIGIGPLHKDETTNSLSSLRLLN